MIGDEYRPHITTQSYGQSPRIADVAVVELPLFSDEGGDCFDSFALDQFLERTGASNIARWISFIKRTSETITGWRTRELRQELTQPCFSSVVSTNGETAECGPVI